MRADATTRQRSCRVHRSAAIAVWVLSAFLVLARSDLLRQSTMLAALRSTPTMRWAIGGWSFFIAENIILSENRSSLRIALASGDGESPDVEGDSRYHLLYGSISTLATASIGYAYLRKVRNATPLQWPIGVAAPPMRLGLCFILQALGLAGLTQALPKLQIPVALEPARDSARNGGLQSAPTVQSVPSQPARAWAVRCPFDFAADKTKDPAVLHGADRVSRHLGLWSFGLTCLGEALAVASVPQAAWLAMPTLVALIGGAHADSRYARGMGGEPLPADMAARTSNVPFWAMLSGAQGSGAFAALFDEAKVLNAACATAVAAMWALRRLVK